VSLGTFWAFEDFPAFGGVNSIKLLYRVIKKIVPLFKIEYLKDALISYSAKIRSTFTLIVFLLGIFRRATHPSDTRVRPCALLLPRGALPHKELESSIIIIIIKIYYITVLKECMKHFLSTLQNIKISI
jgi:hypothetical protein